MTDRNFSVKNGIVVNTAFTANSTAVVANGISVNSTGTYVSGTVNSTSYTVGTTVIANTTALVANGISVNSTGTYVSGTVNSTSYSIGSSFVANSTNLSLTDTQISITKTVGSTTALVINQTAASGAAAAVTINQNSVSGSSLSVNHFSSGPYGLLLTANSGTGAYIRSYTGIPLVVGNVTSTFVGVYANGNVGIGTSTPDALLKVAADANVTGNVVIGGSLTAANVTASLFTGNVTGTSSNATNLNNQPGSYYTNATNISTGTLVDARLSANYNTGTALTANNANYLGTIPASSYVNTSQLSASLSNYLLTYNGTVNGAIYQTGGGLGSVANGVYVNATSIFVGNSSVNVSINATSFSGTSSNATNLNNQPGSYYTNATNITTGTLADARLSANYSTGTALTANNASYLGGVAVASYVNTSGNFTVSGNINFTAANNVINATSHTVGSSFVANSTVLNTTGSLSSANLTTTTNTVTIGTAAYHVANGNFGIGTSTPDSQLKVVGYANITIAATFGNTSSGSTAVYAYSNNQYAIYAVSNSAGAIVGNSNSSYGVYGSSISSYGVYGLSASNYGVIGSSNTYYGVYGLSNTSVGVVARSTSGNPLIAGNTTSDLFGVYANGNIGIGSSSPPTTLHINAGGYAGIMLGTNDTSGIVLTKEVSDNSFNIWQGSYGISGVSRFKLDVNGNIKLTGNTFVVANSSAVNTFGVYANGNIGIGTSSPPYNVSVQGSPNATIHLSDGTVRGGVSSNTPVSGAFYVGSYSSHPLTIGTVNAERMRIDTSGNVGIGTSSPSYKLDVSGDIRSTANVSGNNSTFVKSFIGSSTDTSGVQNIRFGFGSAGIGSYYNNVDTLGSLLHPLWFITNGATVGHISVDGSSTYYMSSSDYRLKTNVKPLVSGLNTINSLKPVSYTWIKNNQQGEGFIAHELQEIIPLAVSGQKDAVDDQGNIVAQGIDPSKLVVHLVVSIQELSQKIEDLTTKLKSSGIEV